MNGNSSNPQPYRRPSLAADGPRRGAAGYYRAGGHAHTAVGGIPLVSAEAAVVAAVRMGYKVAQAQVDRSARLAQRLRRAGDNAAGPDSELKAADAAERLLIKSAMTGLSWLEATAAEPGSPIRRLLSAEYRMLGSLFGLSTPGQRSGRKRFAEIDDPEDDLGPPPPPAAPPMAPAAFETKSVEPLFGAAAANLPHVDIIHEGKVHQHATVLFIDFARPAGPPFNIDFICAAQSNAPVIKGSLSTNQNQGQPMELKLTINTAVPAGLWRGCLYLDDGAQQGVIEIRL